jgi:hypothetical protein
MPLETSLDFQCIFSQASEICPLHLSPPEFYPGTTTSEESLVKVRVRVRVRVSGE